MQAGTFTRRENPEAPQRFRTGTKSSCPIRTRALRTAVTSTKLSLVWSIGRALVPKTVNIHEAKTHLSRLVDDVAAGAEVIIAKAGRPVARLISVSVPVKKKKLGLLKGKIKVAGDFNAPLPDDVLASFEGR